MDKINKNVNVETRYPITVPEIMVPIRMGVTKGLNLNEKQLLHCICNKATVDEILKDKSLVRLNLANYNKDNEPEVKDDEDSIVNPPHVISQDYMVDNNPVADAVVVNDSEDDVTVVADDSEDDVTVVADNSEDDVTVVADNSEETVVTDDSEESVVADVVVTDDSEESVVADVVVADDSEESVVADVVVEATPVKSTAANKRYKK